MSKTTVIQVYLTNHEEKCAAITTMKDKYLGFGDLLRGTIALYQLSKYNKFNFYVHINLHPISNYIIPLECPFDNYIQENKDIIPYVGVNHNNSNYLSFNNYFNFIKSKNDIILVLCNDNANQVLTEDCKLFFKNFLQPKDFFQLEINKFLDDIPIKNYNIFQFRMGDSEMVYNQDVKVNYKDLINKFIQKKKLNPIEDLIISDSKKLKECAKELGLYTTDIEPRHFGVHNDDKSTKELLLELFIMIKAQKIKSYTVYSWKSGFSLWISKIYDIPLEHITI
jgi:hypothetical protein